MILNNIIKHLHNRIKNKKSKLSNKDHKIELKKQNNVSQVPHNVFHSF